MGGITKQAPVFYSEKAYVNLNQYIKSSNPSSIFILVDSNTQIHCLPYFLPRLESNCIVEVVEMDAGEEFKNIETCTGIWNTLSELGADRKTLIINLGGGVVTDLGGFVASTFKRGIPYINIPTTLLSMVDASVGGKTGIDLGNLKNQVGVISQPEMVLIDSIYLKTLESAEMRSGLAEILKHGLIANKTYWTKATHLNQLTINDLDDLIKESIQIKTSIVEQDPTEDNLRKTLNFGHTFGHALESYFLTHPEKKKLLHGEAVVAGILIASYISNQLKGLSQSELEEINSSLLNLYSLIDLEEEEFASILKLLRFDKKNSHGNINFVLLEAIGKPIIDCTVTEELLINSLRYYINLKKEE